MATAASQRTFRVGRQLAIPREDESYLGIDMPALARKMWAPMLAMGLMAVATGVVVGIIQASSDNPLHVKQLSAWNPGVLFMGIGFLLSGVTFLLATILGELRDGGSEVQRSLGEKPLVIKRPWTGWVFPPIMMMGLMVVVTAFGIGLWQASIVDTRPGDAADIAAWVGPLRFGGLAMIFTGISLALATIVRALRFQADRITQIAEQRGA